MFYKEKASTWKHAKEIAFYTYEYKEHYKILPQICEFTTIEKMIKGGKRVPEGFSYTSDNNTEWMTIPELQKWIEANREKVGTITKAQVEEIAKEKMPDLNAASLEAAMSMVAGTARSMGVVVID